MQEIERAKLEKCFEFIIELEKLKSIERKTKPLGQTRYENSAEHSWQVALFALVLCDFSNTSVDIEKVIKMLLVHDIGEIDAGDVLFFDDKEKITQKNNESNGIKRILSILPTEKADELLNLWDEFENGETAEAEYARSVDRVMPMLQNLYNNKQSWIENGITKETILTKTSPIVSKGSKVIWQAIEEKINLAFE
jgi:putative hydrolases of HD superfamily